MTNNSNNEIWIFLSHSNKDYEKVRQVRNYLEELKFRPLMFFLCCLEDDEEIDNLIKREIDHRTRFIYCESDNSKKSRWVQEEVKYIKSKDRIFETINLDLPIPDIIKQLESFRKKTNIFISYQRDDLELAKTIANRLKKYEFNVWIDFYELRSGSDVHEEIENALLRAVNNGYVIAILNERILTLNGWTRKELLMALQKGEHPERSIIPVIQDRTLWSKLDKDFELHIVCTYGIIDSSNTELTLRGDYIVNEILMRVLPPGAMFTHAQNFETGFYGHIDLQEAEKLYAICFKIAESQEKEGNTAGYGVLGYCYEHGYGTEKNLNFAIEYYREAAKSFPQYQDDCRRLHKQLYGNEGLNSKQDDGIWITLKRIWQKILAK